MSVITKSTLVYSDRKNNVYKPADTINFYLPPSLSIINTKNTYLVFNLKMTGTQWKAAVSQKAGVYGLIRSIQISSGDGATVLETLDNYAYMQALKYYYEATETQVNLAQLHEGLPSKMEIDATSCNQYVDATAKTDVFKTVEVTAPLYLSGCLNRDQIWPNIATQGLRVKIELNTAEVALQAVTGPLYSLSNDENSATGEQGGYGQTTGYAVYEDYAAADDVTEIYVKHRDDALGANITRVLPENTANPTHLFAVGQHVRFATDATDYTVTDVYTDTNNGNQLRVVIDPKISADVAEDTSLYISTDTANNDMGYEISALRMNVSVVEPPKGYMESVMKKINSGGLNFDIQTYTDFSRNISAGSLNNTIPLNARNTRCKALLTIPQAVDGAIATGHDDSFAPYLANPRSYNYLLYNNILVPDRRVNLTRFSDGNYDAVALREMMLALHSAGINVNTVRDSHKHWFLGRRLALRDGYSYDAKGQITLNLNYVENGASMLLHNYLIHKRQIRIKPDGIAVVL